MNKGKELDFHRQEKKELPTALQHILVPVMGSIEWIQHVEDRFGQCCAICLPSIVMGVKCIASPCPPESLAAAKSTSLYFLLCLVLPGTFSLPFENCLLKDLADVVNVQPESLAIFALYRRRTSSVARVAIFPKKRERGVPILVSLAGYLIPPAF